MIHRCGIHSAERFPLVGTSSGFASGVLLAKATTALVFWLPLAMAMLLALPLMLPAPLAVLLFAVLLCCSVRSSSAAAAPPSASFPSGITGRRIRSLIHVALYVVSLPAGCGTPTFFNRFCWPRVRTLVRETARVRLNS